MTRTLKLLLLGNDHFMLCKPLREFSHPRWWFRGQNSDLKTITFKEFRDLQDSFLLSIDIKTLPAGGDSYKKDRAGGLIRNFEKNPSFLYSLSGGYTTANKAVTIKCRKRFTFSKNGTFNTMVLQRTISKTCAQLNAWRKCRAIVLLIWNIFFCRFLLPSSSRILWALLIQLLSLFYSLSVPT